MMKRVLGVCVAAAFLVVGVQSRAEAVPVLNLHICQGVTCMNFGPSAGSISSGVVTVGDYQIRADGGSFESAAFSQGGNTNINVTRVGGSSALALDVWLNGTGYVLPIGTQLTMDTALGATRGGLPGGATAPVSYQAWISNTNGFGFPPVGSAGSPVSACTPSSASSSTSCAADAPASTIVPYGPFSLTSRTTFGISIGDNSLYGSTGTTTVTAQTVPEPASLFLLGSGLLAGAGSLRRRLRK